jgi:DNA replication protein DnaC
MNVYEMARHYASSGGGSSNQSSGNGNGNECSEQSTGMVDAILAQISKLDNVPNLNLIDKGQVIVNFKDKPIQITQDIFFKIMSIDVNEGNKVSSIKLSLMSNTLSAAELGTYVKNVYQDYLQEIKNSLGNNIYFFDQKSKDSQPPHMPTTTDAASIDTHKRMRINTAPKHLNFTMTPFYSNKQFSNIYGDEIRAIESRLRFFIQRRDWYDSKGIPYQLGFLLSGIPGAGKTSVIRAIANLTKRHIINVNFANITTATQLKNLFYSDKIQVFNDSSLDSIQSYFIPIQQRIYVIEELDGNGDIVKQRCDESTPQNVVNDELTLQEILTVLDGTMEIPGRIVIMTTNHPEILDRALIRPGRIDVKVHFDYASVNLIVDMFGAYMDDVLPDEYHARLPDKKLSPAEVGQVLFRHFGSNNYSNIVHDLIDTANCKLQTANKTDVERKPDVNIEHSKQPQPPAYPIVETVVEQSQSQSQSQSPTDPIVETIVEQPQSPADPIVETGLLADPFVGKPHGHTNESIRWVRKMEKVIDKSPMFSDTMDTLDTMDLQGSHKLLYSNLLQVM